MERKYIRVRPSAEPLNPQDIVNHIASLHKLTDHNTSNSIKSRINPLDDTSQEVPEYEFLVINRGKDAPVDLLYGTDDEYMETLKKKLTTAYPSSFDIEKVEVDILEKIIPPEKYKPEDFVKKMKGGELLFDEEATGSVDDIDGTSSKVKPRDEQDETETTDTADSTQTDVEKSEIAKTENKVTGTDLDLARPSETTKPNESVDTVSSTGEEETLNPEDISGYDMLKEIDAGLLEHVDLPDEIDANHLESNIDGPTWTEDGDILARPTLEQGEPIATRWYGEGERKKDWMTTIKMFSKIAESGNPEVNNKAPLATLIQHLSDSNIPIAFQVTFKRMEDWSDQAKRRKDDLHLNRDTLGQKVMYEVGQVVHKPSKERRRERRKDQMEDVGESADTGAESPITGDVGRRRKLIDNKIPKRTFRSNIRAVAVANDEIPVHNVKQTMNDLASVLDHIDGYFYGVEPELVEDGHGFRNKEQATREFHRLINRKIVTGSGKKRPDIILNADELANFLTVPSSENLTIAGARGTRAEAESRDPLPKPDPDLMKEFHRPGMRIGYALDKEADTEPVPTQVPPDLLTTHYGRFATTGGGKSKALINDMLSLFENTNGPTILIDPKGDGMAENYMRSHFERFGEESFKEDVIHFPMPDVIPGFSFFNIESTVERRMDGKTNRPRDDVRRDVVQNKADAYQEVLKLVMGLESYQDSKVAPIMISAFIKILYDEEYVRDKQRNQDRDEGGILSDRESMNHFPHKHLEEISRKVKDGRTPHPVSDANIPIQQTIEEQINGDEGTFSVIMNSVFNRINYIREDQQLRKLFNNTEPQFNFNELLNKDKVILFDLGDLRDEASMVITGVILTELWDAIQASDQTVCTQGHESREECKQKARRNGLDERDPPCREEWDDEHLINMIIDEAASVTVSSVMTKMLEQGRSFNLSMGLSMQFPEQMKSSSERVYKNVLNNIGTKLIGKISLDEEIAKTMAHEGMDVETFNNRISSLPRGEWIAQLPSPKFMETGPEPFSLQPLPIPAGHPEGRHVLTEEAEQRFEHYLDNVVRKRTRRKYGITSQLDNIQSNSSDATGGQSTQASNTAQQAAGQQTQQTAVAGGSQSSQSTTDGGEPTQSLSNGDGTVGDGSGTAITEDDLEDTQLNEVNVPDSVVAGDGEAGVETGSSGGGGSSTASGGSSDQSLQTPSSSGQTTPTENGAGVGSTEPGENTTVGSDVMSNGENGSEVEQDNTNGLQILGDVDEDDTKDVPGFVKWTDDMVYKCRVCGDEYFSDEKEQAIACCRDEVEEDARTIGDLSELQSLKGLKEYIDTKEAWVDYNGEIRNYTTVIDTERFESQVPDANIADGEVRRVKDLSKLTRTFDEETIGGVLSAVVAAIPPTYHEEVEEIVEWYLDGLRKNRAELSNDVVPTEEQMKELIYETRPAAIDINTESVLSWLRNDVDSAVLRKWGDVGCNEAFKRYYSTWVRVGGANLARPGKFSATYGTGAGLGEKVSDTAYEATVYGYSEDLLGDDASIDKPRIESVSIPSVSPEQLDEYGITEEEGKFMKAVVLAMDGELEGYSLVDSMSEIESEFDVDTQKLIDQGYVEQHTGVDNRAYYTVTSEGQNACNQTKTHGYTVGDLGDNTPHRVGVELVKEYYNAKDNITVGHIETSPKRGGEVLDVVVYDDTNTEIAVIEVEAGGVSSDEGVDAESMEGHSKKSKLQDYEEIRRDYQSMRECDGESVWVVRNAETCGAILRAMRSGDNDDVPFDMSLEDIKRIENRTMKFSTLNKKIAEMNDPGVSKILTYKSLRREIERNK